MFTGLVTHTAKVKKQQSVEDDLILTFEKPEEWDDLEPGDSVATDGVCLTVTDIRGDEYDCELVPETLSKTTFGQKVPKTVNLERPLRLNDRFGGHFVQGHVDGVGKVTKIDKSAGYKLHIDFPADHRPVIMTKGSLTVNGVSLTVADVKGNTATVALIPYTLEHTTLGKLKIGDVVNLEFDIIGQYIANIMGVQTDAEDS